MSGFDVIGDIHGCMDELTTLLLQLEYRLGPDDDWSWTAAHPFDRKLVFLGDFVDRGPDSPSVLSLAHSLCTQGLAFAVQGNHDSKLWRKLRGRDVKVSKELGETLAQLERVPPQVKDEWTAWLEGLPTQLALDDGKLIVAHAGMKEELQGADSSKARAFALYGETTGEEDEYGLPVRLNWASKYSGKAAVVYGHTPVREATWTNETICIDTGCVFGGKLTCLRWPERMIVSVDARRVYLPPKRPFQ